MRIERRGHALARYRFRTEITVLLFGCGRNGFVVALTTTRAITGVLDAAALDPLCLHTVGFGDRTGLSSQENRPELETRAKVSVGAQVPASGLPEGP
jgi:hypothetical protein